MTVDYLTRVLTKPQTFWRVTVCLVNELLRPSSKCVPTYQATHVTIAALWKPRYSAGWQLSFPHIHIRNISEERFILVKFTANQSLQLPNHYRSWTVENHSRVHTLLFSNQKAVHIEWDVSSSCFPRETHVMPGVIQNRDIRKITKMQRWITGFWLTGMILLCLIKWNYVR